jgi:hypothetical protein
MIEVLSDVSGNCAKIQKSRCGASPIGFFVPGVRRIAPILSLLYRAKSYKAERTGLEFQTVRRNLQHQRFGNHGMGSQRLE